MFKHHLHFGFCPQDSTDWTHRLVGHLLAKVRAGTSQTETTATRTPFQKHSTRQDDASHQMRTRRERAEFPNPLLLKPKPQNNHLLREELIVIIYFGSI